MGAYFTAAKNITKVCFLLIIFFHLDNLPGLVFFQYLRLASLLKMQIYWDKPIAAVAIPQPMGAYSRTGACATRIT